MTQIAGCFSVVRSVASDAGFHREVLFLGQDFLRTDLPVAFLTLELGIEVRFVAKNDKIRNTVDPDPRDRFAFLGVLGKFLNVGAVSFDGLVTFHTVHGRGDLLEITLGSEFVACVASKTGIRMFLMAEWNWLLNGLGGRNL